jgi:hypothetical protein
MRLSPVQLLRQGNQLAAATATLRIEALAAELNGSSRGASHYECFQVSGVRIKSEVSGANQNE